MKATERELQTVLDIILSFRDQTDTDNLLDAILIKLMELTSSDAGTVYVREDNELRFAVLRNHTLGFLSKGSEVNLPPIDLSAVPIETVAAYTAVYNKVVSIDDVYHEKGFNFEGTKKYDKLVGYRTKSMLAIPLFAAAGPHNNFKAEVVGVVQLINKQNEAGEIISFGSEEANTLSVSLAHLVSSFLVTHVYLKELKILFKSIVSMMSLALDERSIYNTRHTQNVTRYVANFSSWLSQRFEPEHPYYFHESRRDQLIMAALVHDIGKMLTPIEVMNKETKLGKSLEDIIYRFHFKFLQLENQHLRGEIDEATYHRELDIHRATLEKVKVYNGQGYMDEAATQDIQRFAKLTYIDMSGQVAPLLNETEIDMLGITRGTLTDAERQIMNEHVVHTAKLLGKITVWRYFSEIPKWASDHHELLDGSGYPQGLSGDEIAIETRMITISDIFDALTASDRPYKKALSIEKSLQILTDMATENKLDEELVALFIESESWLDVVI